MAKEFPAGALIFWFGLTIGLPLLAGCGKEGNSGGEAPRLSAAQSPSPDSASKVDDTGHTDDPVASGTGEAEWQISIEGQPVLSGQRVMAAKLGDLRMLTLIGANAMVSFNLRGAAPAEPYSAQIGYLDSQLHCARGAGDSPTGEVLLSAEGERILVSGTIGCRPPEGEREQRAITGWFPRPQSP